MWKNFVERGRPQMKTWLMRIACCIPRAKHTDSEYVILIDFSLQQWMHERAALLGNTYIAYLFNFIS